MSDQPLTPDELAAIKARILIGSWPTQSLTSMHADALALLGEVVRLQALVAAGLAVAEDLDGDREWAERQIRTALTTGAVTEGAPVPASQQTR